MTRILPFEGQIFGFVLKGTLVYSGQKGQEAHTRDSFFYMATINII